MDGSSLAITQTAIKRFLNPQLFGVQVAYYSQWGRVMAPSDLAVGTHTLGVQLSSASSGEVLFANTITFHTDGAGTGACL